ncbi:hypothetical protein SADUNF_Sadunf16G0284600 [Salix dunnii]|uniref:Uncharacterized protein n=1 Tax=Salix dunnii TaxID=1413687 RepID=A0A835J999_9ROSI|nr:hypothetical protein SADUNF_Sadunf16G0284600 [Salix dunnii]
MARTPATVEGQIAPAVLASILKEKVAESTLLGLQRENTMVWVCNIEQQPKPYLMKSGTLARLARRDKLKQKVENVSLVLDSEEESLFGLWKLGFPEALYSELMKISQVVLVNALTDRVEIAWADYSGTVLESDGSCEGLRPANMNRVMMRASISISKKAIEQRFCRLEDMTFIYQTLEAWPAHHLK